ncbi:hypothetical protein Pcinc_030268 [Petrolisthes cinctipes]|uniref:DNA polymerase alpha subunit B n=1 Tax=Petrolisthes cinctipes TaxID=88211 RepID=A0AAE1K4H4_PETCI|nr:hypothetical protein Pcinc_030268 [Petrolisthes cinctipes]
MATAGQLVEDFEMFGVALEDNKLVEKCLELCNQYGIEGEELAACWVSFSSTHGVGAPSEDTLEQLERENLAKPKKKTISHTPNEGFKMYDATTLDSLGCDNADQDEDLLAAYGGTPTIQNKRAHTPERNSSRKRHVGPARSISAQFSPATLSPSVATPSLKYSSRTNSGTVVATYGDVNNATWTADPTFTPEVKSLALGGEVPLTESYKYMFEKVRDAGEALDDAITVLADQMMALLGQEEETHLRVASNERVCAVGRVCCDSVGHLNAASVLLEGSRSASGAATVPLDLSRLKQYSLFPGQIVGVAGVNPTGNKLLAQELIPGKLLPPPTNPVTISSSTGCVQVVVGCGPFTTTDNLLYEPLTDLLTTIQDNPPHLLILLGPFLDAAHPFLVKNELSETHEAVFSRCLRIITSALEKLPTKVILVSSSRDVCGPMVYPTPPYSVGVGSGVTCVSDPALLDIQGVVMALTSTDILFHLGKEEISFPPQGSDRLGRLTQHILRQQSLYPLYPPAEGMCIDLEQAEMHARLPSTPHILVIPSDLRYFAREVEKCVVVNPERLAKGLVGGTYTRLELHPPSPDTHTVINSINAKVVKV